MAQTRLFRDRIVSMEQTLEGGEKHLELLKEICREALPEFEYSEHVLDHERDLFVMALEAPDGRRKRVGWTRMTLFDAERIPSLIGQAEGSALRGKIVRFLQERSSRPEIVVTFRHIEEGWTDTPEQRPSRRRRRRGGRGAGRPPEKRPGVPPTPPRPPERSPRTAPAGLAAASTKASGAASGSPGRPPGSRRRSRRRRRGRGGSPGAPPPPRPS